MSSSFKSNNKQNNKINNYNSLKLEKEAKKKVNNEIWFKK